MKKKIPTIIAVDDSLLVLKVLEFFLSKLGNYNLIKCNSYKKALLAMESNKDIDMFILDYDVPDMTGIDFVKILNHEGIDTPIVFVTATRDLFLLDDMMKCSSNVQGVLTKPYDKEYFGRLIKNLT